MTKKIQVITPKNLIITGLIIYLLYISFCNKPVTPVEKPVVKTTTEQVKAVASIDSVRKVIGDSFILVIKDKEQLSNKYFYKWQETDVKLTMAERAVEQLLNETPLPDTCLEFQNKIKVQYGNLKVQTDKYKENATKSISALQSLSRTQKSFLEQKDKEYKLIHNSFDTAIAQQKILEKYIKKIEPKREVIAGIGMLTSYNIFKPQVGVLVGYRNKKGIELTLGYYTNNMASISLSKPLIRF